VTLALAVVQPSAPPFGRAPAADPGTSSPPVPSATVDPAQRAWVEVERRTSAILIGVAILSGIVSLVIGLLLAEALIRPLRRLGDAASAVAGGDLGRRSGVGDRRDEIGELGRSFDTMAAALERSDSSRRRFLQDAAHELGTPVTAIHTTASAILDGLYEPEPRHIATIRDEARLLARIVDDLRTIALAEVRQLPMQNVAVEMAGLAAATADALGAAAARAGCTLVPTSAGPAWVSGDPDRLRQVVSALVDNAIRHSPTAGLVTIRTSVAGAWVTIEVEDQGPGLGAAVGQVFDRFFRADAAPDRTAGHAGLGLAIVRALVEAHGGRVSASDRPAGGAVFRLELPAREPHGDEGPASP
jgi:signal transduction histidine kinase